MRPVLGGAIGARFADCTSDRFLCGLEEMGKGMMVGGAVAVVVDNVLLHALSGETANQSVLRVRPASSAPFENQDHVVGWHRFDLGEHHAVLFGAVADLVDVTHAPVGVSFA